MLAITINRTRLGYELLKYTLILLITGTPAYMLWERGHQTDGGVAPMILGVMALGAFGAVLWIIYRMFDDQPVLKVDSRGVMVRPLFGKSESATWSEISAISLGIEEESAGRGRKKSVRYLYFNRLDGAKSAVKIAEYRLGEPLPQVLRKLLTISEAGSRVDQTFRDASEGKLPPLPGFWNARNALGLAAVLAFVGFRLYERLYANRSDLTPTHVEITCVRASSVTCEVKENVLASGRARAPRSISRVDRIAGKAHDKLTIIYLASPTDSAQIAILNLNKVVEGLDSERQEPLASLNRLKAFIEKSQDESITVSFDQPDL